MGSGRVFLAKWILARGGWWWFDGVWASGSSEREVGGLDEQNC